MKIQNSNQYILNTIYKKLAKQKIKAHNKNKIKHSCLLCFMHPFHKVSRLQLTKLHANDYNILTTQQSHEFVEQTSLKMYQLSGLGVIKW